MSKNIKDIIIDNKYMKQVRLIDGVLINVYKCKFGYDVSSYIKTPRKQLNKIEDCFYITKEILIDTWRNKEYPIGTILYKSYASYYPILKINDKKDWDWEIKTTGNAFSGNTESFKCLLDSVSNFIKSETE